MTRKLFDKLTDEQYAELERAIDLGTPAQKLERFTAFAQLLKQQYPRANDVPAYMKAMADMMYIAAVNSDPQLLATVTRIGATE